jgi:hypothetical protein
VKRTWFLLFVLLSLALLPTARGQFGFATNADGITVDLVAYSGPGGDVIIPRTNGDGLPVTGIDGAFAFRMNVTNVTIPDGVEMIGFDSFLECFNLASVIIPKSVTNIAEQAFFDCSLTNVTIPSGVVSIGKEAFEGCQYLTTLEISGSVSNIGPIAFGNCPLTSIFFGGNAPNSIENFWEGKPTIYYFPGTTGWSNSFDGLTALLWNPALQTADAGFGLRSNQFGFNITGTSNIPIVLEACTNLAIPIWIPLQVLNLTNGLFYFSEPFQPNNSERFYRISLP